MNQNPANLPNPQQPPVQPPKKAKKSFAIKPQHLMKKNGIQALYTSLQTLNLTQKNKNDTVEMMMRKIVVLLKTWHFQMVPKYSFDYFLKKCRALGNEKTTQIYMTKVRRIHKGQQQWQTDQNANQQQQNNINQLDNINLDHLDPNYQEQMMMENAQNGIEQTLQRKIQRAIKLVNQIDNRQIGNNQVDHLQAESNRMQMEGEMKRQNVRDQEEDSDDDDCEELFKQMEELEKEKKKILAASQQAKKVQNQGIKAQKPVEQEQQQTPYVPEGFQDVEFDPQSQPN